MVDRLTGSHDSLVRKWIQHVEHADALRGLQHDHDYTTSKHLPPPPVATATMTLQGRENESSSSSGEGYNSPLEVPSPDEGMQVCIL